MDEAEKWAALQALPSLRGAEPHGEADEGVFPVLQLRDIFFAYGGVLCLVFEGFPEPLLRLKAELEREGKGALGAAWAVERMGSKWAKVSLAAIDEDAKPEKFDIDAIAAPLKDLCLRFRPRLADIRFDVAQLTLVRFASSDLANRVDEVLVPVARVEATQAAAVPADHRQFTRGVANEFLDADPKPYLAKHLNDEPAFASRYTVRKTEPMHTLVFDLARGNPDSSRALAALLSDFRRELDAITGKAVWRWFEGSALHCTVRGL